MEHISRALSSLGRTKDDARVMGADEIKARVRSCARLFAAWPNARPASLDLTLLEYVNATRGVPVEVLPEIIGSVIAAGGEFLPPAGAVLERVARHYAATKGYAYNPHVSGDEQRQRTEEREAKALKALQRGVEPVHVEEIAAALQAPRIEGAPRPGIEAPRKRLLDGAA